MANRSRYKDLEKMMTLLLIASALDFVLYLVFAGAGIVWLKVITAIFAILMPVLCLGFLYMSKELLKQRSYTASLEINGEEYASATATLKLSEENYNKAVGDEDQEAIKLALEEAGL